MLLPYLYSINVAPLLGHIRNDLMSEEVINVCAIVVCLLTIAIALFLFACPFYNSSAVGTGPLSVFTCFFTP
jgi:hypothetical protein